VPNQIHKFDMQGCNSYVCFTLDCYLWKELLHISARGVLFIDEECREVRIISGFSIS